MLLSLPRASMMAQMGSKRYFSQKVTFTIIDEHEDEHTIEASVGENMMSAGLEARVPFQVACGGNAECCTCHCFFPDEIIKSQDYTEPDERELDALDFCEGATDESRLAC